VHVSPLAGSHPFVPQLETQLPETQVVIPVHAQSPGHVEQVSPLLHTVSPHQPKLALQHIFVPYPAVPNAAIWALVFADKETIGIG
jgi:hypothetical protein